MAVTITTASRKRDRLSRRRRARQRCRHLHLSLEVLEERLVLTAPAVVALCPLANSYTAPVETDVSVIYDQDIGPASVSAETFVVHGMQSVALLNPPNVLSVTGATITLTPGQPFFPGELVEVTATTGIENLAGENAATAHVWQFRTEVGIGNRLGSGIFAEGNSWESEASHHAVALGDLNGDGHLDLFVGIHGDYGGPNGNLPNGNRVWLNDGSGNLTDTGQRLGDTRINAVTLGDLDGDGDLDAFVVNSSGRSASSSVWLNRGNGTFVSSGQNLGDSNSLAVALGDVDGDGDLDALVGNRYEYYSDETRNTDKLWLNDGRGRFTDSGQILSDSTTSAVALADLDGDGDLDAWASGIWLNDGSGTLSEKAEAIGVLSASAFAFGDLDADGDLDAVKSNTVWRNDGHGSFSKSDQTLGATRISDLALGDLDGDGDLDIFSGNNHWSDTEVSRVWLNDGSGEFTSSGQIWIDPEAYAIALGDLDGDGDLDAVDTRAVWLNANRGTAADLAIVTTDGRDAAVPGEMLTYTTTVSNNGPFDVIGATVRVDFPRLDEVTWTCSGSTGSTCTQDGTGDVIGTVDLAAGGTATYVASGSAIPLTVAQFSNLARVDVPDGTFDFRLENNTAVGQTRVAGPDLDPRRNSHTAPPSTEISIGFDVEIDPATVSNRSVVVHGMQTGQLLDPPHARGVNGNIVSLAAAGPLHAGELMQVTTTAGIASLNAEHATPLVWQFRVGTSGGSGYLADTGQRLGDSHNAVALGDLDGDGDLDVFVGNDGSYDDLKTNRVWLNDGFGNLTDTGQSLGNSKTRAVALGDLDGDGDLDAFVANSGSSAPPNLVWLNDGSGTFVNSGQSLGSSDSRTVTLGDVDGDGDLDALVGNEGDWNDPRPHRVWLNDGFGRFTDSGQALGDRRASAVALADFDADGDLDAWADGIWLNNGTGTFGETVQTIGGSYINSVDFGDLDADGDLDAVLSRSVWLNDGSGIFTQSSQTLGDSSVYAVALGDLDGDGDLDALVGGRSSSGRDGDRVWFNDGTGVFTGSGQAWSGAQVNRITLGDLDGDGDLDALDTHSVWLNANHGTAADLAIVTTDGQDVAVPGEPLTYTTTVTNNGPYDVTGASVRINFPRLGDASWTCSEAPGSACTGSGTGNVNDTIDLPSGGSVTYVAAGTLLPLSVAEFSNLANVDVPGGLFDYKRENNVAVDRTRVPTPDLVPRRSSHTAPADTQISVGFDVAIDPATISNQSVVVHGMQTGQLLDPPHARSVTGNEVRVAPAGPLHAGEMVQVTTTSGVTSLSGEHATPLVWQFRAGASGGSGYLADTGQSLGDSQTAVALGDLDGDGDLDAFVGSNGAYGGLSANRVWLNDGSGNLTNTGQSVGNSNTNAVALGDLDGDGDLDAFVANDGSNRVWLNGGHRMFDGTGQRLGSSDSQAVALGDLDGDGDLDAFVGNSGSRNNPRSNRIWWNNGRGRFTDSGQALGDRATSAVALADVDGDGDLDAWANGIWLNDGSGTFRESGQTLSDPNANAVAFGDLDGDGNLDALIGNAIWLGDGRGSFSSADQELDRDGAAELADLDGDGDLDIVATDGIWQNAGQGIFPITTQRFGGSGAVATGDLDNDGDVDAVLLNQDGQGTVWLNVDLDSIIDLSITNSDSFQDVVRGQRVTYTIQVTNKGPNDVVGAVVTDRFPALLTNINWTCAASAGSSCTASGTGDIDEVIDLPLGGTVTFTVVATVDPVVDWPSGMFANSTAVATPAHLTDRLPQDNTATDTNRLAGTGISLSDGTGFAFFPPSYLDTGSDDPWNNGPSWVTNGDVDGDGNLDIMAVQDESGDVLVWRGRSDGSFVSVKTPSRYSALANPTHLTTGDVDGDGDLDIIVTSNANGGHAAILMNNGVQDPQEGWLGLGTPILYPTGADPTRAIVKDLDLDGAVDLVVASSEGVSVRLGFGDGTGTFGNAVNYTRGAGHRSVAAGNFDGDASVDLVVVNEATKELVVLQGNGDGTFEEQADAQRLDKTPFSVAAGDLDGDGDLDLAITQNYSYGDNVSVLLGNGNGSFQRESASFEIAGTPASLVIGDVDADGDLDLAIAHSGGLHDRRYGNFPGGVSVLLGNGNGAFGLPIRVGDEGGAQSVALGDVDQNGAVDLIWNANGRIALLLQNRNASVDWEFDRYYFDGGIAAGVADYFDIDGYLDMAVVSSRDGHRVISVLLADERGGWAQEQWQEIDDTGWGISLIADDLNGDGQRDLVTATRNTDRLSILLGHGDGTFAEQVSYTNGDQPEALLSDDFDRDGHSDIVTLNSNGNDVSVLLGRGDGTLREPVHYSVGRYPGSAISEDLNGDGYPDLVVVNSSEDISVLIGIGDGTFAQQTRYEVGQSPFAVLAEDLNGDGHLDLVVASHSRSSVTVLIGNGDGTFVFRQRYVVAGWLVSVVLRDVNRDGVADVILAGGENRRATVGILLGRGDGTFAALVEYPVGHVPSGWHSTILDGSGCIVVADLDGDDTLDVTVAGSGDNWGSVSVLRGLGDGTFTPAAVSYYPKRGFTSVIGHDVDGDGVTDLVLTGPRAVTVLHNRTVASRLRGDMDWDGDVDFDDLAGFVLGLNNPAEYETLYGRSANIHGDIDRDGDLDFDDIAEFVARLNRQERLRGDINGDGRVNGLDIAPFVNALVDGQDNTAADVNQDGVVNGLDVEPLVTLILHGNDLRAAPSAAD